MTCPLRKIAYQLRISKWYFETTFVSGTSSGNAAVGVCPRNDAMDAQVGYDDGQGTIRKFQSNGNVYRDGGTNSGSGATFNVAGDTVGVAIDATSRTAWFSVNGGVWNGSASNDPATGVGGYPIGGTFPLFPAICSDVASVWTVNFTGPFAAASPTGFIPWSQGNLQLSLGDCADVDWCEGRRHSEALNYRCLEDILDCVRFPSPAARSTDSRKG
ncbi:SPRY domain-containing protein [Burkholderia cepacia]|uniref:SPRY domain-containing protein n=1 Tax=Burkholderia cepacia TaxID=292 RepID=UPI003C797A7F